MGLLEHIDIELMVHLILASCVLHNFCLLHDDFDEGYFRDNDEDDDSHESGVSDNSVPGGPDGLRVAEAKRVRLMNIIC